MFISCFGGVFCSFFFFFGITTKTHFRMIGFSHISTYETYGSKYGMDIQAIDRQTNDVLIDKYTSIRMLVSRSRSSAFIAAC